MEENKQAACQAAMLPIADALYVLQGKWRLAIIHALSFECRSFGELERQVAGITTGCFPKSSNI